MRARCARRTGPSVRVPVQRRQPVRCPSRASARSGCRAVPRVTAVSYAGQEIEEELVELGGSIAHDVVRGILEYHEACAQDRIRDPPPVLHGEERVERAPDDEGGNADARQQWRHVVIQDVQTGAQQRARPCAHRIEPDRGYGVWYAPRTWRQHAGHQARRVARRGPALQASSIDERQGTEREVARRSTDRGLPADGMADGVGPADADPLAPRAHERGHRGNRRLTGGTPDATMTTEV